MNVDVKKLPSLLLVNRKDLPNIPAIYFALTETDEILYIGKTKSLVSRWANHHRLKQLLKFRNVKLCWFECKVEDLERQEKICILEFDPPFNYSRPEEVPLIPEMDCKYCTYFGKIGTYSLFYCTDKGIKIFAKRNGEPAIDASDTWLIGGNYSLNLTVKELISEDQPTISGNELEYEDFYEFP